jgi:hypothetical protein
MTVTQIDVLIHVATFEIHYDNQNPKDHNGNYTSHLL